MDPEFLESDDARPLRILAEYLEPLRRLKQQNIQDTVVFFGSARVAQPRGRDARARPAAQAAATPRSKAHARRDQAQPQGGRVVALLRGRARAGAQAGRSGACRSNRRATASSSARAAVPGSWRRPTAARYEAGGKSIGFNIRLPFEQGANRYITDGLHFEFHYFFMRKFWFAYLAKALVIFPGGFGTLDEMFEILTLAQTQKLSKQLGVFIYGREYWEEIIDLKPMEEWGAINAGDLDLLKWVNTPDEAFEKLRAHLMAYHLVPETAQEDRAPGIAENERVATSCSLTNATQLIAQYKDGYRVGRRGAAEDHAGGARRDAGAGQVDGAPDRPPPRRQRDDGGGPLPAAARRGQAGDQGLRPGSLRRAAALRAPARGVARALPRGARLDGGADGMPDRGRLAARRHAQRGRAASASTPGCASTRRTRTATPIRSASPAAPR